MAKTVTLGNSMIHAFDTAKMPVGVDPRLARERNVNWAFVALMVVLSMMFGPIPLLILAVVNAPRIARKVRAGAGHVGDRVTAERAKAAGLLALCFVFPLGGIVALVLTRGTGSPKVRTAAIVIVAYRLLVGSQPMLVALFS